MMLPRGASWAMPERPRALLPAQLRASLSDEGQLLARRQTDVEEQPLPSMSRGRGCFTAGTLQAHLSGNGIVGSRHTAVFALQQPRRSQGLHVLIHALV